jgi:transaldolase
MTSRITIKLFADGADLNEMLTVKAGGRISGFTTNPTLMRKAGITDYVGFAKAVLDKIPNMPISFEVFSDELPEMERQAREIATWGTNVYVKIPVTNTKGESCASVVSSLSEAGVKLNVTAIFTLEQVHEVVLALAPKTPSVISVFAGRIANAGVDPMPLMRAAVAIAKPRPLAEVLWASPREALNVLQAQECGCHIITMTPSLIEATATFGKDLTQFSRETVEMFYDDARAAGYSL